MVTCDRAFQEWDLFGEHDRYTFETAIEKVSDFIRRLEKMFRVAYGRDAITPGTRDALLYGQLQEGLSHHLVGPWLFRVLPGVAARNEERRAGRVEELQAVPDYSEAQTSGQAEFK